MQNEKLTYEQKLQEQKRKNKIFSAADVRDASSQIKICDIESEKGIKAIAFSLVSIAEMVGITTGTDEEQEMLLTAFVMKYFGNQLTPRELVLAFELNAAGKLDNERQHYNTLNIEYVGAVLNAYIRYRNSLPKEQKVAEVGRQLAENAGESSEEYKREQYKAMHESMVRHIEEKNELPRIALWNLCYEYLENAGLIVMTLDEKKKFFEEVKNKMMQDANARRGQLRITAYEYQQLMREASDAKLVAFRCREELAKQYYSKMLK